MERLKQASLYIFFGLLAYMPLHIFLSTWLGTSFGMLEFTRVLKDVVLVIGAQAVLIVAVREPWFKEFLKDKLAWLIGAYALLTLGMALLKPTDQEAEILGIVYNLRFLLFFIYGALLTRMYKPEWLRRKALQVVLAAALLVLTLGVIQYLWLPDDALTHLGYSRDNGVLPAFHIDDKPDLERAMSTLRDPNSFGSYVIITLLIALVYLFISKNKDLKKMLAGFGVLSLLCLYFTFSRAAWIGAVLAIVAAGWLIARKAGRFKIPRLVLLSGAVGIVVLAVGLFVARDSYFVRNVVFHADEATVLEDPNELRLRFWSESVDAAREQPLGYGPGTAGIVSIRNEEQGTVLNENYYLQILHEVGLLGLVLFLAITLIVAKRLYDSKDPLAIALLASLIGLLATNFLAHIWSNEAVAYTWWGLVGLSLFVPKSKNRSQPPKVSRLRG